MEPELPIETSALTPQSGALFIAPRGLLPSVLLQQVKNTAAFLFESTFQERFPSNRPEYEYLKILRESDADPLGSGEKPLSHLEYFFLCLAAHHATVGTFVPTDVDNQIRFKLWHPNLPTNILVEMADVVIRSRDWDYRAMTTRWITSEKSPRVKLGGHEGEWLSTAAAAYGSLRKRAPEKASEVAGLIIRELQKEADIFQEFRTRGNGVSLLKTATLIAHNLGDLDRVLDMWYVSNDDALKLAVFKAGHVPTEEPTASTTVKKELRFGGVLYAAGKLNKEYMAIENHRHFALRTARALRGTPDLLLPIAPFLDDWGSQVAAHPKLSLEDKGLVAEALIDGWERLTAVSATKGTVGPVGYARALAGMLETFPGGFQRLSQYLPAKLARTLQAGPLRSLCAVPKKRFEERWSQMALRHVI